MVDVKSACLSKILLALHRTQCYMLPISLSNDLCKCWFSEFKTTTALSILEASCFLTTVNPFREFDRESPLIWQVLALKLKLRSYRHMMSWNRLFLQLLFFALSQMFSEIWASKFYTTCYIVCLLHETIVYTYRRSLQRSLQAMGNIDYVNEVLRLFPDLVLSQG